MSSHHIVREKQEPALFIVNLDGFEPEDLGQLLEWSPTLIVLQSLYEQNSLADLKIDGIATPDVNFIAPANTKLIRIDSSPIRDILNFLVSEGYPAVNILNNDFDLTDYEEFVNLINIVIYNGNKKIYPIKSGFSKWKPGGEKVELMQNNIAILAEGLNSLDQQTLITEKDGFVKINFSADHIFIAEYL